MRVGQGSYTERKREGAGGHSRGHSLPEIPGSWLGGEREAGLVVEMRGGKEKGVPGVWNSISKGLEASPREGYTQAAFLGGGQAVRPGREI